MIRVRIPGLSIEKFLRRLLALVRQRFFWLLTIVGNLIIFSGAVLFYTLESNVPSPPEFIDCLLLSAGLVTTTGYANYFPVTVGGKIAVFLFTLFGTLFIWIYMAFFVTGLIAPELNHLEQEVHDVERELKEFKKP